MLGTFDNVSGNVEGKHFPFCNKYNPGYLMKYAFLPIKLFISTPITTFVTQMGGGSPGNC